MKRTKQKFVNRPVAGQHLTFKNQHKAAPEIIMQKETFKALNRIICQ